MGVFAFFYGEFVIHSDRCFEYHACVGVYVNQVL